MTDWNAIVDRYGRLVWRTVYRFVGDYSDASDCYQQTFLDAVKVANKKAVRDWPGLLKYLATVRALDLLRVRRRRRKCTASPSHLDMVADRTISPAQKVEADELVARLRDALSRMPPAHAEVVYLSCFEQMTYSEIAERLEITTNSVGVILHRARLKLEAMLAPVDAGPSSDR